MKMPSQISGPILKNHNFREYDVIKQSGSYNANTGAASYAILKFTDSYDMALFISMLFVEIRTEYTSCDSILLAEMIKSSEIRTNSDKTVEIEFVNYWM